MPRHTVLDRLNRFIKADTRLARGYPVTVVVGNVPVTAPAAVWWARLILIGDVPPQVDPLMGEGNTNAMAAGQLAAQVACEAIVPANTSQSFLGRYAERWQASMGCTMARNHRRRSARTSVL